MIRRLAAGSFSHSIELITTTFGITSTQSQRFVKESAGPWDGACGSPLETLLT